MVSQKDFLKINQAFRDAQNDDTPFLITSGDGIAVAGDPNKTQKKIFDYEVEFRFPKSKFPQMEQADRETDNFYFKTLTYSDVSVAPETELALSKAIVEMLPLIKKILADGSVEDYTLEEELELWKYVSDDVVIHLRKVAQRFLDIDEALIKYIELHSLIDVFVWLGRDFPEVLNSVDSFLSGGMQGDDAGEEPEHEQKSDGGEPVFSEA